MFVDNRCDEQKWTVRWQLLVVVVPFEVNVLWRRQLNGLIQTKIRFDIWKSISWNFFMKPVIYPTILFNLSAKSNQDMLPCSSANIANHIIGSVIYYFLCKGFFIFSYAEQWMRIEIISKQYNVHCYLPLTQPTVVPLSVTEDLFKWRSSCDQVELKTQLLVHRKHLVFTIIC